MWGANRRTLGLFPEGAFEDCTAQGRLVVALAADGTVAGYLTFRVQRRLNSAAIVHLCTGPQARGKGCSDILIGWLKEHGRAQQYSSLRLKCRRDYHAEALWQRLGFVARGDVRGRGTEISELTVWVHSYGEPDLFTMAAAEEDDSRLKAVIDANIFYDLHGRDGNRSEESLVLSEPWMDDAVQLCVVDELHNEINRCETGSHREEYHRIANTYPELPYDAPRATANETILREILQGTPDSESKHSDRRQLARAAAAGADVFVTRDGELLEAAVEIEARLGIRVRRPTELSSHLDETERASAYQPLRLSATALTFTPLRASDAEAIAEAMQSPQQGEKRSGLLAEIRAHLAKVRSSPPSEIKVVRDEAGAALALQVTVLDSPAARVLLLRVRPHELARTLARHFLLMAVHSSAARGGQAVHVTDPHLTPLLGEALQELHFTRGPAGWERLTPSVVGDRSSLLERLSASSPDAWATTPAGQLEERFWPAKVLNESIPTYIVAIDPTWAAQLFDSRLAADELFGAFARLALNRENVYYRSARKAGLVAPARLLWYVTKDGAAAGTMAVRACSRLVQVETGPAKSLYGRYRRIGIYEWREVFETAGRDPQGPVMALRFADTELFTQPVGLSALRTMGITSTFQSPTRIDETQFERIYQLGHLHP